MAKGGARPGAGRKKSSTLEYQASRRATVERVVTDAEWTKAIEGMLAAIAEGNAKAFAALAPYVMGAAPKEVTVKGDTDHPFVFVVE